MAETGPQQFFSPAAKVLLVKYRVLRCAQLASRRLLRKTVILTQMLRQRNSATASKCPDQYYRDAEPTQLTDPVNSARDFIVATF